MALTGLKARQNRVREEEARKEAAENRVAKFSLEGDGDSAVIRFIQELDVDAKNYSNKNGIGGTRLEHSNPEDEQGWRRRAQCSVETQGGCFACDKRNDYNVEWDDRKKWGAKERFLINVVGGTPREVETTNNGRKRTGYYTTDIDLKTGDGTVYLLEQSVHNGIYEALVEYFLEEEVSGGTITDKFFKVKRNGSEYNNTSYVLTPLSAIPDKAKDVEDFEVVEDLYVQDVPLKQQEAFYYPDGQPEKETWDEPEEEAVAEVDPDEVW